MEGLGCWRAVAMAAAAAVVVVVIYAYFPSGFPTKTL
jgi:anti-sigma-K factor RskA